MKIIIKFFLGFALVTILNLSIYAQETASSIWPCTMESRVDTGDAISPSLAVNTGNVTGIDQTSGNVDWRIRSYSGTASGTSVTYQRWWPNDGNAAISWGNETAEVADRYVEFSLSPNSGYTFNLDSIQLYLLGGGTSNMRANIYYSTDGFTTRTQLNPQAPTDGIILEQNSATDVVAYTYSPVVQIDDNQSVSVRVYPFYAGSPSTSKYVYFYNCGLYGTTAQTNVPVELTSFSASVQKNTVELKWTAATEVDNNGFEIERSRNKATWNTVGFVKGSGTTTETSYYLYKDVPAASGKLYYRLKQVDFNGAYKYSKVVEVNYGIPNKFNLAQNYPNPFNPSTSIKFELPEASFVNLTIYNLLGAEVETLVNEKLEPGTYTKNFNAINLTSGIYFYRLTAGNMVVTKKMSLLK